MTRFVTILLLPLLTAACLRLTAEDPSPSETLRCGPSVSMEISDGIRTLDRILRMPSVTLTLEGGDPLSEYEARLSIGGGDERVIRHIWNDYPKSISGELLTLREYGSLTIRGYLCPVDDRTLRLPVDTLVWMSYAPASLAAIVIRYAERALPLGEGLSLPEGTSGLIEASYTPTDTFLPLTASAVEDGPLRLRMGDAVNRDGLFRVPFSVTGVGTDTLTLLAVNGRDTLLQHFTIHCTGTSNETDNTL